MNYPSKKLVATLFVSMLFGAALASAHADPMPVKDPLNILEQSDQFLGAVPFEFAFKMADTATFENNRCNFECKPEGACEEICKITSSKTQVRSIAQDSVTLTMSEKDEETNVTLTRAEYDTYKGNMLRYDVTHGEPASAKDYITLDAAQMIEHQIGGNKIPGLEVIYTHQMWVDAAQQFLPVRIRTVLVRGTPSVAQVAEYSLPGFGHTYQRLTGFVPRQ